MTQDLTTGRAGDAFGRKYGRLIGNALGATKWIPGSNCCELNGERVVIKCARRDTPSVGITYRMMERVAAVVAAFETAGDRFLIYRLPISVVKTRAKPTSSQGSSAGKVGIISRRLFESEGVEIPSISVK
jgi:hypothetical protein